MRPRRILLVSLVLALLTASAQGLFLANIERATESLSAAMISRFLIVLIFATFGLTVAQASAIRGSVVVTSDEWKLTVRDVINYGVLPGLVLGLINFLFFFTYRYSPFVAPRFRNMRGLSDSFILSLNSGVAEEVIYRLFILSSFLFLFRHLYGQLRPRWPSYYFRLVPPGLALVISSYLFALAHSYYAFVAAFFGGILLGLIYVSNGIESAIAAHFCANFLFYSAAYLS